MSKFVEVKTAELIGPALDWAVAKATQQGSTIGRQIVFGKKVIFVEAGDGESLAMARGPFCPSTCWAQGGPLLDSMVIGVIHNSRIRPSPFDKGYQAMAGHFIGPSEGHTILIAACRAIVADKLGDVVLVPAYLVGVAS